MFQSVIHGRGLCCALLFAWVAMVAIGARSALQYENTPGESGTPPARIGPPAMGGRSDASGERYTLYLVGHPECPCTKASIHELNRIISSAPGRLNVNIVFFKPEASEAEIRKSARWTEAATLQGVNVRQDRTGDEVRRLGAKVSGQVMLYDSSGMLLFSGGITGARGHEGDNAGESAILNLLHGKPNEVKTTPVYGCTLFNPDEQTLKEEPSWKLQ